MKRFLFFVFVVVIFFTTSVRAQTSPLPSSATVADSIIIYPNPCHGSITITVYGRVGETFTLSIYNSLGTEVFKSSNESITEIITNKKVEFLPFSTLRGIYCVHFVFTENDKKETVIKKVVVN